MLIGNLTRNPVIKSTNSESLVCTFGLATNSIWKDASGSTQERTEFHNIVAWNKLAEICGQILSVGMAVYIEGELRTRTWVDGNGVRHYRTEIKALDMKLLDSKNKKGVGVDAAKKAGVNLEEGFEAEEGVSGTTNSAAVSNSSNASNGFNSEVTPTTQPSTPPVIKQPETPVSEGDSLF